MGLGTAYKSFKKSAIEYDAIIIGSGLSGLTTAAILSKEGKKVLVLEQHFTAGGASHVFKRKGYEWDVGLHYVGGEVSKNDSQLYKLFNYITDGKLEWSSMGSVYDIAVFGDKRYEFRSGKENFVKQMAIYFPSAEDQEAVKTYLTLIQKSINGSAPYFAEKILPLFLKIPFGWLMRRKMLAFGAQTTLEVLESITKNKELIAVLTAQYGDYGLPPGKSSFVIHAMVVNHYMEGASYPVGGSSNLAGTILPVIAQGGGEVVINAKVDHIIITNNEARGVTLSNGDTYYAKKVVSAAGLFNTYNRLIPTANQNGETKRLSEIKLSVGHVCLYVGIKKSTKELNLKKSNYWIFPEQFDHDSSMKNYTCIQEQFPFVYVSFPSAKDPDWESKHPDTSTIEVLTVAKYEWFAEWEQTSWKKRGDDYEVLKEQIAKRLLAELYKVEPQLEGLIDYYELSTPLSTQKFCNYPQGGLYGFENSPARFRSKDLNIKTSIKNLYLTGQDVVSPGIGGALLSGYLTSIAILNKNIFKKAETFSSRKAKTDTRNTFLKQQNTKLIFDNAGSNA